MIVSGVKRRPIGLYFGLVRVHCRSRKPILSQWDEKLRKLVPCFDTHARRRVGDSVWRSQVRAHVASHAGRTTIEGNDDVASCFESVRYRPLQFGAQRYEYPMGILRLSLSTYIWPRRIALGGVVARPVFQQVVLWQAQAMLIKNLKLRWPRLSSCSLAFVPLPFSLLR